MDRRVDLTLNRDFGRRRRRSVYEDIPRSIFKRKNNTGILTNFISNSTMPIMMDTGTGTSITTTIMSTSLSGVTINNNIWPTIGHSYNNGEICDCCGKNITRLPWQRKTYGCLCRKCYKQLKNQQDKRIPWK